MFILFEFACNKRKCAHHGAGDECIYIYRKNNTVVLQWRHNGHDYVSNHQRHDCLLNRLFRCRSKKTSKFRVTGLCAGNSPVTGEFPAQMASSAENVSVWWRHHLPVLTWIPWCSKFHRMTHSNELLHGNRILVSTLSTPLWKQWLHFCE